MNRILIALIIVFSLTSCSEKTTGEKIRKTVEKYVKNKKLNGTLLVANKDSIIYQGSFGYANVEKKDTITSETIFPIASLTKQFTATGILILQEDGKLSIDDKMSKYIEVPSCMKTITIKNLMNHTSGIPDYVSHQVEKTTHSILNYISSIDKLKFIPNTQHSYSNTGYFLLGQIIEKVSGKSYGSFLQERIFKPIGMSHTFVYDGKEYKRAIGYDLAWNRNDYLMFTSDGGILSTISDIYLWDKALSNNTILSPQSESIMFKPTKLNNGKVIAYGLGWNIDRKNRNIVSHAGSLASFGTYNQYDIENDCYIILFSNQLRPELLDLIEDVNDDLY